MNSTRLLRFAMACSMAATFGCSGQLSEPGGTDDNPPIVRPPPGGCQGVECEMLDPVPAAAPRFIRLTHEQWENTVRDLFQLADITGESLNFDADSNQGTFTNDSRRMVVTAGLWPDYQRSAERIAAMVAADRTAIDAWSTGAPTGETERDGFIREIGLKIYRRPITDAEVASLRGLYDMGGTHFTSLDTEIAGVRVLLEGMLQSPHFLYRVESSNAVVDGLVPLNDFEIASRLSYMLWSTMPDDGLFADAAEGHLTSETGLRAAVERLLNDAQAAAMFERFHGEHFHMDDWHDYEREAEVFSLWRDGLAASFVDETHRFLSHIVGSDGGVTDLLLSKTAFVDDELAPIYGVAGTGQLELGDERAGLLTRLAFLGRYAARRDPDPIHRGLFINEHILCRDLPDPPNFDADDLNFEGNTNRQRIESITGEGTCGQGCHGGIINPPGLALESFDSIGAYRMMDNGEVVDDTSTYVFEDNTDATVTGGVELSQALSETSLSHECYSQRLLEYALGRAYFDGDSPLVYQLGKSSIEGTASIRDMVVELALSRSFRTRSAEELAREMEAAP